jgi:hypothetical protein
VIVRCAQEIVREFPLTHLRRWAAAPKNFTLDFGDYQVMREVVCVFDV